MIQILGWHVPENATPFLGLGLQKERSPKGKEYGYIIVMQRGNNSGFLSIVSQRTAGYDADEMSHFGYEIASKLSMLHNAGLVHFDCKLRPAAMEFL